MALLLFSSTLTVLFLAIFLYFAIAEYRSYYQTPQHWMLHSMKLEIPHSPAHRMEMLLWHIFLAILMASLPFAGVLEALSHQSH